MQLFFGHDLVGNFFHCINTNQPTESSAVWQAHAIVMSSLG